MYSLSCCGKKLVSNKDFYRKYDCEASSAYLIIDRHILNKVISEVAICKDCGDQLSITIERNVCLASELKITCDSCLLGNRPTRFYTSNKSNTTTEAKRCEYL